MRTFTAATMSRVVWYSSSSQKRGFLCRKSIELDFGSRFPWKPQIYMQMLVASLLEYHMCRHPNIAKHVRSLVERLFVTCRAWAWGAGLPACELHAQAVAWGSHCQHYTGATDVQAGSHLAELPAQVVVLLEEQRGYGLKPRPPVADRAWQHAQGTLTSTAGTSGLPM